jgi:hypothetical protein
MRVYMLPVGHLDSFTFGRHSFKVIVSIHISSDHLSNFGVDMLLILISGWSYCKISDAW